MSEAAGKNHPVSHFRRLVIDLMHFSAKVPSITVERRMELAALVAAREACSTPPTWTALFTKAYARVAAGVPALRTTYLTFPWPRFYEHPVNVATLNIDRRLPDERIVIYGLVQKPECCTLQELDAAIRRHQQEPVNGIPSYRNAVRLSRVPWPFRRLVWWAALNVLGSQRCRHFGTFGITSLGALGAGITQLVPLLTTTLHYGQFDPTGHVEMRLSFDHRVFDGATAAEALTSMEAVLLGEILRECTGAGTHAEGRKTA
jgi:hypothetical protein